MGIVIIGTIIGFVISIIFFRDDDVALSVPLTLTSLVISTLISSVLPISIPSGELELVSVHQIAEVDLHADSPVYVWKDTNDNYWCLIAEKVATSTGELSERITPYKLGKFDEEIKHTISTDAEVPVLVIYLENNLAKNWSLHALDNPSYVYEIIVPGEK